MLTIDLEKADLEVVNLRADSINSYYSLRLSPLTKIFVTIELDVN